MELRALNNYMYPLRSENFTHIFNKKRREAEQVLYLQLVTFYRFWKFKALVPYAKRKTNKRM